MSDTTREAEMTRAAAARELEAWAKRLRAVGANYAASVAERQAKALARRGRVG